MSKIITTIENFSDDFDGYSLLNNKKCIVKNSIIGDEVEINIIKETKDCYIAEIVNFIKYSEFRQNPVCKHFNECGGCQLQNLCDKIYYNKKQELLKNTLEYSGYKINDFNIIKIKSGLRRRINLKYEKGKYGFFSNKSNNLVEIEECPNVDNDINYIIKLLKNIKLTNLDSVDILKADNGIRINFIFAKDPKIQEFKQIETLKKYIMVINYTNVDKAYFIPIIKNDSLYLNIDSFKLELPDDCFLQPTQSSQNELINIVVDNLKNCKKVADFYSGIGTYSFPLSKYTKVSSFEGSKLMIESIKKNCIKNKVNIISEARDLLNQPLIVRELNNFDGVVMNPPRNGAEIQCKFLSKSDIKTIIYVSCNPKTLSRDLKIFKEKNFIINNVYMLDQFYWSKHTECVIILKQNNFKL